MNNQLLLLLRQSSVSSGYCQGCDDILKEKAADALEAAQARIASLEEALTPFAGEKPPSHIRFEVEYDRNGLRRAMSPLEIAMLNAHRALLPPLPTPKPPCKNCDGKPNCYCARAALAKENK